jgi:hypothetical protein
MISIFSGCLVLISHYQNLLNLKLEFRETLINSNNAVFTYYSLNLDKLEYDLSITKDIFDDGISTSVTKKKWGFYDLLSSKTIFKGDTIRRIGLIGNFQNKKNSPVLYVTNYDRSLKVGGNTTIKGISKVPNGSIEHAYLNNQQTSSVTINGQQLNSEDKLPTLDIQYNFDLSQYKKVPLSDFKSKSIINSFDLETLVIDVSNISDLRDIIIKGNVILFSSETLTIFPSAELCDIVLIAKKVVIESNFSGNMQIVSNNEVTLNKNSQLKYPSSIYIKNDTDSVKVHLKEFSKIAGGIIIDGSTYEGSLKRKLIIDKSSKIYGSIYCYGNTQLQGEVIGEIYTDRFFLKTKTLDHQNIILDGKISRDSLPENFVSLTLSSSEINSKTYEIIKEF